MSDNIHFDRLLYRSKLNAQLENQLRQIQKGNNCLGSVDQQMVQIKQTVKSMKK